VQLIQKYNYAELKRKEGGSRLYLTPDGESLPSVTTVLSKTQDKSFLKEWKARVGEKKAEEIVANSSAIGTALHLYIEHLVNKHAYEDLTPVGVKAKKFICIILENTQALLI